MEMIVFDSMNNGFIRKYLPFLILLACVPPGICAEQSPQPSVQLLLNSVNAWNGNAGKWLKEEDAVPHFAVNMLFRCRAPWKIAGVHPGKTRLELADSLGNRTSHVQVRYGSSVEGRWPVFPERPRLSVDGKGWLPRRKAQWVEVRGTVVAVVSDRDEESAAVKIQLKKGFRVPVVLERAAQKGMPGGVHAELAVVDVPPVFLKREESCYAVLELALPPECVARDVLFPEEAGPVKGGEPLLWPEDVRSGKTVWRTSVHVKKPEGAWVDVRVRYASGLKDVMVPVSFRVGMNGIIHQGGAPGTEGK